MYIFWFLTFIQLVVQLFANELPSIKCRIFYPQEFHSVATENLVLFHTTKENALKISNPTNISILSNDILTRQDGPSLVSLDLTEDNFTEINQNAFKNIGRCIQFLYLSGNKITRLSTGVFNGLPELRLLDLSDNGLVYVEPKTFNVFQLDKLILKGNKLTILPMRTFTGLTDLKYLDVSYNNFLLSPKMFEGLSKLETLNMSNNNIKTIPENTFTGLKSVVDLYLDHNSISILNFNSFKELDSLETLNISYNPYTSIKTNVLKIKNVDFSGTKFEFNVISLLEWFPNLQYVKMFNMDWPCTKLFQAIGLFSYHKINGDFDFNCNTNDTADHHNCVSATEIPTTVNSPKSERMISPLDENNTSISMADLNEKVSGVLRLTTILLIIVVALVIFLILVGMILIFKENIILRNTRDSPRRDILFEELDDNVDVELLEQR